MKLRLALVLAVLVLAPLASLAWLGARFAADARAEVVARFDDVIRARLAEQASAVGRLMAEKVKVLVTATDAFPEEPADIRDRVRRDGRFRFVLVLDSEGRRVFPPADGPVSEAEEAFVERTRGLWQGRALGRPAARRGEDNDPQRQQQGLAPPLAKGNHFDPAAGSLGNGPGDAQALQGVARVPATVPLTTVATATADAHGWHVWYWGGGLNLMFWRRISDGRLVAVEVDRVQLLADVVARLPDTGEDGGEESTALVDSAGEVIYQWGAWTPPPSQAPRILHALPAPLAAWRLAWTGAVPVPAGMAPGLLAGLIGVGLALAGLAVWFYRESTRALREAARRVTFVNQVSHELKTPLTNIRMYAELLADELDDEDERAARHVAIIEGESQRLSRLIGNILTFARKQRETLRLRPTEAVVDDVVRDAIEGFGPSLERCGVAVAFEPGAPARVRVDADALGQILGNLLSNVEKYAHGGPVRITSLQTATDTTITVHDSGPGIPRGDRQRVFEPFERLSDALEEGVSGTGIGLGIARDLARLHGGDLTLLPTERGAAFELRVRHA